MCCGYTALKEFDLCWNRRSKTWIESTGDDACGGVVASFDGEVVRVGGVYFGARINISHLHNPASRDRRSS
jgi:hypothetical protein